MSHLSLISCAIRVQKQWILWKQWTKWMLSWPIFGQNRRNGHKNTLWIYPLMNGMQCTPLDRAWKSRSLGISPFSAHAANCEGRRFEHSSVRFAALIGALCSPLAPTSSSLIFFNFLFLLPE